MLSADELVAIMLSLKVGVWSVLFGLPVAFFIAMILCRTQFRGKIIIEILLHIPLVLPPVVTGYILLYTFGRNSLFSPFLDLLGIQFAFNWKGAVLAAVIMSFPLMVRSIKLALESIDPGLEDAARTLGAGEIRTFFRITLPLTIPGVIAASILGFARSLGEFGATITFVSNIRGETQTLPLALYSYLQIPGGESSAMKLCFISLAIAFLSILFAEIWARRQGRYRS